MCRDVNECSNPRACEKGYQCRNTVGSYRCEDINECTTERHQCDRNAYCVNIFGGYNCVCNAGYEGDGKRCTIPSLPSGYKQVKSDFGTVFYKLYTGEKKRPDALLTCTSDASYLHFPQPKNKQENLFYYDLIFPFATHYGHVSFKDAIWLDNSQSNSWSNFREGAPSSSDNPYITMIFTTGERDKNWHRVPTSHKYMFVCTAVFK